MIFIYVVAMGNESDKRREQRWFLQWRVVAFGLASRWELLTFNLFLVEIYTRMQTVFGSTWHPSSTDHGRLVCLFVWFWCVVDCAMWNEIKYLYSWKYFIVKNRIFNVYMKWIFINKSTICLYALIWLIFIGMINFTHRTTTQKICVDCLKPHTGIGMIFDVH